jgi:asparagine synthase (glutamine-hydrolysing)
VDLPHALGHYLGFGVPIDQWLRGPLKPWAIALIEPARLTREGIFNPAPIQRKWSEHQAGERNWSYHLWNVLMFQASLESEPPPQRASNK